MIKSKELKTKISHTHSLILTHMFESICLSAPSLSALFLLRGSDRGTPLLATECMHDTDAICLCRGLYRGSALTVSWWAGECCAGRTLYASVQYMGGMEGASECVWLKDDPSTGELIKIHGTEAQLQYTVVPEDLGHMLVLAYTPVRSDGQVGEMVEIVTGESICLSASISLGAVVSDSKVTLYTHTHTLTHSLSLVLVMMKSKELKTSRSILMLIL